MPVALQIPCNTLHFFPITAENLKKICSAAGLNFNVPDDATCCGLPLFEKGETKAAKNIGEYNLKLYGQNQIVCTSPKCKCAFETHYPKIFNNTVSHNTSMNLMRNISDLKDIVKRIDLNKLNQISGNYFKVRECGNSINLFELIPNNESLIWHQGYMNATCCGAGTSFPCTGDKTGKEMAESLINQYLDSGAQAMVFEDDICRKHVMNVAEANRTSINTFNIIDLIASVL